MGLGGFIGFRRVFTVKEGQKGLGGDLRIWDGFLGFFLGSEGVFRVRKVFFLGFGRGVFQGLEGVFQGLEGVFRVG